MLIPDVNLLVYAYNTDAPEHRAARAWWEQSLSGEQTVGMTWVAILGFIRVMSSRRILVSPLGVDEAAGHVRSWTSRRQARIVTPGPRHLELLESLSSASGVSGELTTNLHLAALAIEHQAELHTNDSDFRRFPGLRWRNPLG